MAHRVFGNGITNSTLEGMPDYAGKTITRIDKANVALNMKNAQDKDFNACKYVENLKEKSGHADSTFGLVYNATGDTLYFVTSHDWNGKNGSARYPEEIENGQWVAFRQTSSATAIVYRGTNMDGDDCDWMLAWSVKLNANKRTSVNKVYTEIREAGHYDKGDLWGYIHKLLSKSGKQHSDEWNGCYSNMTISIDTSPTVMATLGLVEDDENSD